MNLRRLGRTGAEVSEIGYGAWGISGVQWIGAEDDESMQALNRAIDLGLNFIDTARVWGRAQRTARRPRGPRALRADLRSHEGAPKNREWPAPAGVSAAEAFPAEHIRRSAEASLEALGLDTIDLLQLHVWQDNWVGQGDWQEAVDDLRAEGKIRWFGISINDHQPANALRRSRRGSWTPSR